MINKIECFTDNMKSIVIYCHGFGDDKTRIYQHNKELNEHNIGIISFDFPCHGDDKNKYEDFNIELCVEYLDRVVNEINGKYNLPLNIIGSSFGGYIALLYINKYRNINKTFLKFPAVNFCECMERKLNINEEYFIKNNYYELPSGFRIYKSAYNSFKQNDIMKNFNTNSDIYILHGDLDKTVLLEDIIYFTNKNNIKLKIVKGASHGMKDYLDLINIEILNYLLSD